MRRYDFALFDLDGTLTQSARGVRLTIERVMETLGLQCPALDDFSLYVGPPLQDTFSGLCKVPDDKVRQAVTLYRDYYNEKGILCNRLYDGVPELLTALREAGAVCAICTSKNEKVAERVASVTGLSAYIDAVCGSTIDGSRRAKADIIPYTLETLGCPDKSRAVMIGDSAFDAEGAKAAEIDFLGVTYGYGDIAAMREYGAVGFADRPVDLLDMIVTRE